MTKRTVICSLVSIVAASGVSAKAKGPQGPVRVFILAGQSNMEGKALVRLLEANKQ